MDDKTRAGAAANPDRSALYRAANGRIKDAIEQGFPLEAVGLLESIIADRLESHIGDLSGKPVGFGTLGRLIPRAATLDDSAEMAQLAERLDAWRQERNRVVHEMAKVSVADAAGVDWATRSRAAAVVARQGIRLFRDLDKHIRARRRGGSRGR